MELIKAGCGEDGGGGRAAFEGWVMAEGAAVSCLLWGSRGAPEGIAGFLS